MRYAPLVLIFAVFIAGLGFDREIGSSSYQNATRSPASVPASASEKNADEAKPVEMLPVKATSLWPDAGERWIYRFERKASAEYQGRTWLNLKLGGIASIQSLGTHGEGRFYQITYEMDRMAMQGVEKNEKRAFPKVRVEIDRDGKLRELRWLVTDALAGQPKAEESDLVRDLTAQWLFFENQSRLGVAETEFKVNATREKLQSVSKRILRYPGRPDLSALDSVHEWRSDRKKVDVVEGSENFSAGELHQKTSYRWVWISTEKAASLASNTQTGSAFVLEEQISAGKPAQAKRFTISALSAEWANLADMSPTERLTLFKDLRNALDAGQSELVPFLVKSVRGRSTMSLEWRTGIGALASTSNPEAAKALFELYTDGQRNKDEKLSILAGVTAGEGTPASEWKKVFEAEVANAQPTASDVRSASLFALGSAIRKEADADRRKDLESILWREVKESNTESAQLAVLDAIGNSGSPEYYAYVKERFTSQSPVVRAKAVSAVRFLASDLAKPVIDSARVDSAAVVRKAAAFSEKFLDSSAAKVTDK